MGKNPSMEQRCKKHPTHKQSKGVCPSCLRERLSHISTSSSSSTTNHSGSSTGSSLSPYSSDYSNSSSVAIGSPLRKIAKTMSFSCILITGEVGKPLKKSRSLAFQVDEEEEEKKSRSLAFQVDEEEEEKKSNKERFWSKLLGRRKEKKDVVGLFHYSKSKTLKQKSFSTKWVFFA